jgi:hypothetical protein
MAEVIPATPLPVHQVLGEDYAAFAVTDAEAASVGQSATKPTLLQVKKPHKQATVQLQPDRTQWFMLQCFVLHGEAEGKGGDKSYYPILPAVAELVPESVIPVQFIPYVTVNGTLMLWPVSMKRDAKGELNSWHASALDLIEEYSASGDWIRVVANQEAGGYDVKVMALSLAPKWPSMTKQEMLDLAFKKRLIKDLDHPVIKAQLGLGG